ncbi:MAG: cytochrome c family protein [Aestuariivita sp.]|nr:cytochrome c family protein [Aestuariivita sp.]
MLDTMTLTKAVGALCGSLLILLLSNWAAEELYHVELRDAQSYVIAIEDEEIEIVEVEEVDFSEVYALAEADKGERLYRQCSACHKIDDGVNGTGPHLYGIVGRKKASVEGFGYSGALAEMTGDWTPENLNRFIENPRDYVPGTTMAYAGLKKIEDRANLISYLDGVDD